MTKSPYLVTCPRCLLQLESPTGVPLDLPRDCLHCGDHRVRVRGYVQSDATGVGRTFDAACADAIQRVTAVGSEVGAHQVREHLVYAVKSDDDEYLMHLVRISKPGWDF